jgi:ribosomal protein L22
MASNTEKPTTIAESKKNIVEKPIKSQEKSQAKEIPKAEDKMKEKKKTSEESKSDTEKADKKPEEKKPIKGTDKPKEKKTEAIVNARNIPVSTKYAVAICKYLKGKGIDAAIDKLEQVKLKKKAIPMKGEIPHRKGKIMSGRFPVRSSEHFITILKGLKGNALVNEIEEPLIVSAIPNQASTPFGRFGRVKRKRTHITLIAKSKIKKKEKTKA